MLGLWLEHKLRSVTALNIHFVSNRYRSTHIYKCIPVRYIADSYPGEALDSIRVCTVYPDPRDKLYGLES